MCRPGDGNDHDDSKGEEEEKPGCEKGTGKGKRTNDGKGNRKGPGKGNAKATEEWKGKGKGNGERNSIVKQTPVGDDISRAVPLQLLKDMYEADSDMES